MQSDTIIHKKDIAIIGMACRFPGANNSQEFWQNLAQGKNSITEIPHDRWNWQDYYGDPQKGENKTNSKWGGFIEDVDKFDPRFFNISPTEANYIDPQHRLFFEIVWKVIENAGYSTKSLSGKKLGVYAGVSKNDYAELLGENISAFVSTGTVHSILANRISYFFNFHGPSQAIDTACSSALVSLHNAVRDIQDGECEAAIVGGVNALLSPRMYISHAKSGMLSTDGQCKTFDESANGYVRGEGVAAIFLKPLTQAIEDRDNIIGIIKSTAVNHGGRSNFLTAPNVAAQTDVVYTALKKAELDPRNISYIEAHGTGTPLGDPIEINGLKKAYAQLFEDKQLEHKKNYCGLGSVKTNIGHLESASGMASIIKVLLAMKYKVLPSIVNFEKLNPYIELEGSPFYIIDSLTDWKKQQIDGNLLPRQAGISGFGMGGVNAHVILEEPPENKNGHNQIDVHDHLILLSTKKGRLKATAQQLLDFIKCEDGQTLGIEDIAFTLMFGRDEFEERLALIANSTTQTADLLQCYLNNQISAGYYQGLVSITKDEAPIVAKATDDLTEFAQKWVRGENIEWEASSFPGKRVELPGHPLLKQRCWFKESKKVPVTVKPVDSTSVYKTTVSNHSPMVNDHQVQKMKTMPGVGYIELIRQMLAAEMDQNNEKHWCFRNLYWLTPLVFIEEPKEVSLSIKTEDGERRFQISTITDNHCQGSIEIKETSLNEENIDIQAVLNRCQTKETKANLYAAFSENGLDYGPSFQVIDTLYWCQNEAIAKIDTKTDGTNSGILDGALQTAVGLSIKNNTIFNKQFVPYYLESFSCVEDLSKSSYYYVKQYENHQTSSLHFDIYCCDDAGRVLAVFKNFIKRVLKKSEPDKKAVYYYGTHWREQDCVLDASKISGLLVINGEEDLEQNILSKIDSSIPVIKLQLADGYEWLADDCLTINYNNPEDYLKTFIQLKERNCMISNIIVQSANPGSTDLQTLLLLVQSLIKAKLRNSIKVSYYSTNSNSATLPFLYAVGGLARTLKYEYPRIDLQVISFDKNIESYSQEIIDELSTQPSPLHETKYQSGRRLNREMVALTGQQTKNDLQFKKGGVYLIAGGSGGLGQIFSEFLAKSYQAKLILLGRRSQNEEIQAFLDKINKLGGSAEYLATDICDKNRLTHDIQSIRKKYHHIDGVIQASGIIEDSFILNKTVESFQKVISPKIQGTVNLDKATAEEQLDFFVMFSSVAAVMPNQGQCDYSSANSFMDYFAEYRKNLVTEYKRSGISLAINWPLWEHGGMRVTPEEKEHLWTVFGMQPLTSNKGLELFTEALNVAANQELTQILCIEGDREKINQHFNNNINQSAALENILPNLVITDLKTIMAQLLNRPVNAIKLDTPLRELGVDSTSLIKIADMVNQYFSVDIKPTLLFEYETLHQINEYLIKEKLPQIKQTYEKLGTLAPLYRSTGLLDVDNSYLDSGLFQRRYSNQEFYMVDHVVGEKFNVPGACYIEMARQAGCLARPTQRLVKLTNNYWAKQLSSSGAPFTAYIQLIRKEEKTDYEIYSLEDSQNKVIHATGSLIYDQSDASSDIAENLDLKAIRGRCTTSWMREQVYRQIHAEGLIVGPSFMPMQEICVNENEALATLVLPEIIKDTYEDYLLHPTMLTGVFQAALINNRFYGDDNKEFIPIAIESLEIRDLIPQKCFVYSVINPKTKDNPDIKKFNLSVCDENGRVLLKLSNFAIKARNFEKQINSDEMISYPTKAHQTDQSVLKHLTQDYLKTLIAPAIGIEPSEIIAEEAFEAYGINSVLILELNQILESSFGSGLSKTLFFEYLNLSELADYFMEEHKDALRVKLNILKEEQPLEVSLMELEQTPKIAPNVNISTQRQYLPQSSSQDIAIIGLAGRYPHAKTLDEFWENLKEGKDCIEEIRPDRFDYLTYFDPDKQKGKLYGKWGSFIDDVDKFDPMFFNISPREAELMDPQERLFLEVVWHTLEDAGYTRQSLSGQSVGVFVGATWQPYQELGVIARDNGHMIGPSTSLYNIANRVSYYCNFNGPSLAVDTACSSSLTALHLACRSIISGECNLAIAGGVNLSIGASKYLFLSQYQFLSSEGKCRSFGAGGDGYVPGEGLGAVLLKPLEKAERDGDHIYGVIKGTVVNHGGKTNGYTVPNPIGQGEMILKAMQQAKVNPRNISYIEAHGTGTALGDPIEINGLTRVFSKYTKEKQFCTIGSVKSNIGHLEASAGIVGLTKVLLQLKHRQIVPSLNSEVLNPHIDFSNTPFIVQQELVEWKKPIVELNGESREYPRIAGISSFGAGGSNAHAVIEEHISQNPEGFRITITHENPAVIVLSAKNEERLNEQSEQLLVAIREGKLQNASLADMAYTLQVGREAMEERLAVIVESVKELEEKLDAFTKGTESIPGLYRGKVEQNTSSLLELDEDFQMIIDSWMSKRRYAKLLGFWVKGLTFDWNRLYGNIKPNRISLPTYPFARERYWLPESKTPFVGSNKPSAFTQTSFIHPLLHLNTSNFSEQRFSSNFTGQEFFLADHVVKGERVLPGVIYLEMARGAVESALGDVASGIFKERQKVIGLKNVVWIRPIVVGDQLAKVNIGLFVEDNGEIAYEVYAEKEAADTEPIVYCQGKALLGEAVKAPTLNLKALQAECNQGNFSSSQCYDVFRSMGADYGMRLQGIEKVYVGSGKVLAKLSLPTSISDTQDQFGLHPSLMDSALQICLIIGSGNKMSFCSSTPRNPLLPFALQNMEIIDKLSQKMWAYVRYSDGSGPEDEVQKFDIDLCDDTGFICVRMKGFSARVLEREFQTGNVNINSDTQFAGNVMLTPVWDVIPIEKGQISPSLTERIMIVGGTLDNRHAIQELYPHADILEIQSDDTIEEIANKLEVHGSIDHIMWIVNHKPLETLADDLLIEEQDNGVLIVFRMIKALLRLGYGTKDLGWSVMTIQSQIVHKKDLANPAHTSLHGLVGTMAKEYPNWNVRLFDLETDCELPIGDIVTLSPDSQGELWVYRGQEWYRQKLVLVQSPQLNQTMYRPGGVYVVIGGAGGIGEVWTEYMISKYKAKVIWIGRRQKDETIQKKLDRLAAMGPEPYYISVDAKDQKALKGAYQEIKKQYPKIHGVIHSAIVLLDQSLANMDEERFRAGLTAKVDVSVRIAQVFQNEPLDFVLFFSSINSFLKSPGQSNYVSGCTFKDAFARQLSREWSCVVKVMNWGYWGNVGIVASEDYRERMAQAGIDSIDPSVAMESLETLLAGPIDQIALLKTTKPSVIKELNINTYTEEYIRVYPEHIPSYINNLQKQVGTDLKSSNVLEAALMEAASTSLNVQKEDIDTYSDLIEYGFDLVNLFKFTNKINQLYKLELTPTIFTEYRNIHSFAQYLMEEYKDKLNVVNTETSSTTYFKEIDIAVPKQSRKIQLI